MKFFSLQMSTTTHLRLATPQDAPAIHTIYAPIVRDTIISFELDVPPVAEMAKRIESVLTLFPWLVCERGDGEVVGYVYGSKHRPRAAYQWGVEVTVYVHPEAQRHGIARGLYTALFELLRIQGFYIAYAGIALPNEGSVRLHTALGFEPIGVYRKTGYKFGRWHDVGWWELALQPHTDTPLPPRPVSDIIGTLEAQTALSNGLSLIHL